MALLEIHDLTLEFGEGSQAIRVLSQISLQLDKGEMLCLVGESGSGKSLTALSIARLTPAPPARYVAGRIMLEGQDVLTMAEGDLGSVRGGRVSYVFQEPAASLNPVMGIGRQILETLRLHRPTHATESEVIELLKRVGIASPEDRFHSFPHQLSGGMQQRVMIAMALASRPQLLVADEPTTALDVTIQAQILQLLGDLKKQLSMGILLITHNLGIVSKIADRIAVMYAGQIVETGPAPLVIHQPRHPYTRALLASMPRLGEQRAQLDAIPGQVPSPSAMPTGCRFHPRCSIAQAQCAEREPALVSIEDDHQIRCPLWKTCK